MKFGIKEVVLLGTLVELVFAVPGPGSLSDMTALLALKQQIWKDPYAAMADWVASPGVNHPCYWNGIKCADMVSTFRVTAIHLTGLGLQGQIGLTVGDLQLLVSLNLSQNALTGPIPSSMGSLVTLVVLDLSYNELNSTIPPEFSSLVLLQKIYLGHNLLDGVPTFLYYMPLITDVSLESNLMTGYPLSVLSTSFFIEYLNLGFNSFGGRLDSPDLNPFKKTLKFLSLGSNNFFGNTPNVSSLTNLEVLDFGGNNLTGPFPDLQFCINLTYVNISFNRFSGTIPILLNSLLNLMVLDVRSNNISGGINDGILGNDNLIDLRLGMNNLDGIIPAGLGYLSNLTYLDLSSNNFSGTIPVQFGGLTALRNLNLSRNQLSGSIPPLVNKMASIDLSYNNLSGSIPEIIGSFQSIQILLLGSNRFTGRIPSQLGQSVKLASLDLSINMLTGPISYALGTSNMSNFFVYFNMLSGEIPDTQVMRKFSTSAFYPGNPDLCGDVISKDCSPGLPRWAIGLMSSLIPAAVLLATGLLSAWYYKHGEYSSRTVRKITDDFNNCNIIGIGGLCTVYKGVFPNGKKVAVKRLKPEYYNNDKKGFDAERRALLNVIHPNIVQVIGSCSSPCVKALLLDYMPNGNLDMHLHQGGDIGSNSSLNWSRRMDIAAGVAQAVAYLHGEWQGQNVGGVMHCDIKGSSVLLDEHFNAHITDVRLQHSSSQMDTSGHMFSESFGYMPPEYALSPVPTTAGDVYTYGTLLTELLTGKKADDVAAFGDSGIQGWMKQAFPDKLPSVIDPQLLQSGSCSEQVVMCTKIALQCTSDLANDRPNMQDVLDMFGQAYMLKGV